MSQASQKNEGTSGLDAEIIKLIETFVRRSTSTQGLPEKVQDAATLRQAAQMMK